MPSPLLQTVTLTSHPETQSRAVHGVAARVARMPGGMLAVTYIVEGELGRVRVPAPAPARMADELWRHTCCELFVAREGAAAYHEFNLAPSGEWAAYAFERYRERVPLLGDGETGELDPQVAVRRTAEKLELNGLIRLDRLLPMHLDARLSLALAAVVEDQAGTLSYWALAHPPGKPDFHHPDAFRLTLDEVRG